MASSARLVTIKRSGDDGAHFPLSLSSCLFGRSIECDIRIQLPVVSKKHCKIEVNGQEAILYNFSSTNPTQVNGATIDEPVPLKHGDIITIIDRSFRYENGNHEDGSSSAGCPGKSPAQEPARRASRASFSVDPDGKGQDAKASKTTASRRSLVHAKRLSGDSLVSDGSKDSVTQDPSNMCSSGHVEQHSGRSIGELTSGALLKKSRATGSSYRELKSSPAQSLNNSKKNDSPFEKLYQSMKEELDIKSQKQSRRKSEPQPECAAGKDTWETKLLVSCKSRPKSSGSTPGTAASSPKVDKIGAEKQSNGVGPVETSTEALSSSFPLSEAAKMKTPMRNPQLLKNEDLHVTGRRESVNQGESEGAKAGHRIVTPRKLGTRNQTSVKVEYAASPADTPENLSSKKRRSIPAKEEVLSAETQNWFSSTQHLSPSEKRTLKDSFSKPEKLATAAEQICSGLPGLSSVDIGNFGDSINKSEGISVKRRRVSFGGHLRPELFDENLPPNTPLKRGETPTRRKSLATHTPAVLKKIIKERPQSPGKQESPGISPPKANDQRRRSGRSLPASSDSKSLHQTDTPKKAGRKSSNLPAKRTSISRSQHDILQKICSKRRSGASEANLIVAKSWADVVKLGTKQTQTKVVKHVPQKQMSKRQRRPNTPKKPTSNLHNQFSTGHANSPCTIVIGRAQIEKVSMPARPYKMLNNLMLNRKMDFNEDLSGLTEMFKTPVKEKQQQMNDMGSILSNSENLPEKQFQVTNSGDKPLPITSEILEENVPFSTCNAAKEPCDKYSASPILRRRSIKSENTVQTPRNVPNITHHEKKTPGFVTEPLKTVSNVSKLRRSRELRHTLVESMPENTEDLAEGIKGRHLRKISLQGQEVDRQVQDSENSSQRFKENGELKEDPEKTSVMRSSAREQKPTKDTIGSQMITQTAACAEELLNQEKGTTEEPKESMHMQTAPICDDQRAKKQNVELVCAAKVKRWSRTPDKKTQSLEGLGSLKEPFETSNCRDKPIGDDKTKGLCKSPQPTTEKTKTSTKTQPTTSGKKVDMKEQSSLKAFVHMSGGTRHTSKVPELEHGSIKALKEPENQMLDVIVTNTKRPVGKAKEKAQTMEDMAGFQELFLSPVPGDKITKMPNKSPFPELVRNPASKRSLSKTGLDKVDVREEPPTLGKRTKSPGRATHTPTAPVLEDSDTTALMETPKQKLDFTENSTGCKRRSRTPKISAQPLEDLDGFQELFQTPVGASDPVTVGETAKVTLECPQPEPVRTPASKRRLSKTGLRKVDVREEPSTLGKRTKSPGRATHTPTAPVLENSDTTALMETPKQKLDFTENSTGCKRRSQTPKIRAQPLEDLDGFQELFQTPVGASDPVTVGETAKVSLECPQPEPVRTPASKRRLSKTGLRKVDVREEPSTLGKRTKSPGRATHTPTAPVLEDSDTTALMETPKQKLDFTENSTGCKRRSQTPKIRAQPLEDLDGFQELFQTPVGASDPVTVGETAKVTLECPQPEPVRTPASKRRLSKTGLRKVDVREEPSTLGKRTKSPGRATHTPTAPVLEDSDTTALMETPKQKLDFTENSTGCKRRSRTPKIRAQPLEDLDGFQELFQTPVGASDPVTVGETAKVPLECPQPEPVRAPASKRRLSKTGLRKVDVREEPSTLGKRTKSPGRATHTPTAPVLEDSDTTALMETPKQKLDFTENSTGCKRRSRTPKIRAQPLEDLDGFQELFQTPVGASDPVTVGETAKVPLECPQPEPVRAPASKRRLSKTGLRKVDVREEPSTLGKRTKSPGRATHTPTAPVLENSDTTALMETPKQKLDFTENSTGCKRRSRTPKISAQPLEDLDGFQELFQTPVGASDPVTVGETAKVSLECPQPAPVRTPASKRRLSKTGLDKVDVREEPSTLGKRTKSPGRAACTPTAPVQQEKGIKAMMETSNQKMEPVGNLTGSKKQLRTPKEEVQSLEDLTDCQELFQTPVHGSGPLVVGKTKKMSFNSPQPEPVITLKSIKRKSRASIGKMEVKELSESEKHPQIEKAIDTLQVPNDNTIIRTSKQSAKRKLDPAANVPSSKRLRRASKDKTPCLEDLSGFQQLFQTPGHTKDSFTVGETLKMSSKSPYSGPVRSQTSRKSMAKISLRKMGVKELSALWKQSPGKAPTAPVQQDNGIQAIVKKTPKDKLETAANVTGLTRQQRAPKGKALDLEDLSGFQELFQTPGHSTDPLTDKKRTSVPLKSPQPGLVRTPQTSKRLAKTSLGKVGVREAISSLNVPGRATGEIVHIPRLPEDDGRGNKDLKESRTQTLGSSLSVTGSKKQRGARKERSQSPEDLLGLQELFQTPASHKDSMTVCETTKMSLASSEPEHISTPASTKRLSKTRLDKVDVREEPSTLGKRTKSPGRATHTPTAPVLEDSDTTALMETPKQKLDFTENSTGCKRRSRTPKISAQPLEDLDGFQELFQTPVGASDPVTVGETTKVPLECPQPEPIRTPASTKRLSKKGLAKMNVREKLSSLNKPRCSSQKVMHETRLSEHDGRGTIDLKESVTQILDPAVSVTHTKSQRGACKKRSQSPEDLFGLQELFQTPGHDNDSVAGDKLTKMPHRSPSPEPVDTSVTSQRQPRTRLMKVHVKSEQSGDRMFPQMSGEIMDISRVAEGEDKGIRTRKQSLKRKLNTAVSVPSSKRQRVAQTLEDLPSYQELDQPPNSVVDSVTVDKATKMRSKSPEPMDTTSKIQPGRRLRRVDVTKEAVAQRKNTRVLRETRNTHKEPVGDRIGNKEFKESSVKKPDPGSVTGKRSQPRTRKEKTQPLEELPSIQEETATRMSCESLQPEEKETSTASKRQLRIRLCKVGVKEEPIASRKPPGRETRSTLKEPMSDTGNVEELKESTKRKTDLAASVPVSKRPRRVPREKAQPLELAGPKTPVQIPDPTEESASDKRLPQMPSTALQPEQVDSLQTSPRRPRTRRRKVEVDEEPSVVRKTVPTLRQTTRSCKVPEIDDKDTQASKEPVKQKLETVANVTGSRRQLRAPKGGVQPLEVLGDSKEITQISEHTEELRPDTSKSTLQQVPDSIKPLRTCRRVLRASKEDTVETMKMSMDTRDPEESQSKSNTFLPPKRKSARDGSVSRTRGLRSVTPKQEATDEKLVPKTQRTAPSKRQVSPEPVKMKHLRIMSSKIEPVEEEISTIMKTEEKEAPPDQKMPLPSRNQKKTNGKQPRPEVSASAETVGIKKNEKTMETSPETELHGTDDGAKKSTARDKVSGKRTCLRSRGPRELPQPCAAEKKPSETEAEILIKTQKKKGVSGDSDVRCLRSRKTGATSDTEPKPRVTQGAKKDTEVPKKDEDIVYTKKLRTRSHQNSKNM